MSHTRFAALGLAAAALAVAGCGGSTKSTTTTTAAATTTTAEQPAPNSSTQPASTHGQPLARAALIVQADAICRRINTELNSTSLVTQRETARTTARVASFEQAALAELSKLTPPASLAAEWSQLLESIRVLASNTTKLSEAATADTRTVFGKKEQELTLSNFDTRKPLLAVVARAGFKDCAQVL